MKTRTCATGLNTIPASPTQLLLWVPNLKEHQTRNWKTWTLILVLSLTHSSYQVSFFTCEMEIMILKPLPHKRGVRTAHLNWTLSVSTKAPISGSLGLILSPTGITQCSSTFVSLLGSTVWEKAYTTPSNSGRSYSYQQLRFHFLCCPGVERKHASMCTWVSFLLQGPSSESSPMAPPTLFGGRKAFWLASAEFVKAFWWTRGSGTNEPAS